MVRISKMIGWIKDRKTENSNKNRCGGAKYEY